MVKASGQIEKLGARTLTVNIGNLCEEPLKVVLGEWRQIYRQSQPCLGLGSSCFERETDPSNVK
jgi:hypothetical protein